MTMGGEEAARACQHREAAFTPLQGMFSKGHGEFNGQGFCQGEGIYSGRAMEREEIAAADGRERKRRERSARQPLDACAGFGAGPRRVATGGNQQITFRPVFSCRVFISRPTAAR